VKNAHITQKLVPTIKKISEQASEVLKNTKN
jgi:hypothetical protein